MDLIDRYVHEVGQHLPWNVRADVEAELRSLLTESVEERARAAGRPADAGLATEVLRAFGVPKDAASRYAPDPQYLIGPRLYPVYRTVLRIMVPAFAAVTLTLIIVGQFQRPGEPPSIAPFIRAANGFFSGLLFNLGLVTLIFALVERVMRRQPVAAGTWDPSTLPAVNDPDRISYFGRVVLLYLIAAVALLFNVYPQWVSVVVFHNTDVQVYALLGPGFARYLPVLNACWAAAFLLNLVVLRQGRWRRPTRWAEFALEVANAVILAVIVVGPPAFAYDVIVKVVLQVFAVISVIKAGMQLFRLLRRRPAGEPWHTGSPASPGR